MEKQARLQCALSLCRLTTQGHAFSGWRVAVLAAADKQARLHHALSLCRLNSQRHAFDAWRCYIRHNLEKQKKSARASSHSTQATLCRVLVRWQIVTAQKRELEQKATDYLLQAKAKILLKVPNPVIMNMIVPR